MKGIKGSVWLIVIVMFCISCEQEEVGLPDEVGLSEKEQEKEDQEGSLQIIEFAGAAHYYINNESNYDIFVDFISLDGLGEIMHEVRSISIGANVKIADDAIIGVNPKPSDFFGSIGVYIQVEGRLKSVYSMNPIDDDEWVVISADIEESGYGLTVYELLIKDSDVILN